MKFDLIVNPNYGNSVLINKAGVLKDSDTPAKIRSNIHLCLSHIEEQLSVSLNKGMLYTLEVDITEVEDK